MIPPRDHADALPVGVAMLRDGVIAYANDAYCEMVGLGREAVVGATLADILPEDEARRVMDRYQRRLRGEPVPEGYEIKLVRKSDGEPRVVEVLVRAQGDDVVAVVRDITEFAGRRAMRVRLAHLGVALGSLRSEAAVKQALREGGAELGLADTWVVPHGDERLRVEYISLPDGGAEFESAVGRPAQGWIGGWLPWLRRAWIDGESYSDDAIAEVARFIGHPWEGVVRGLAAAGGKTRGLALRIDRDGEPSAILVLRGAWLREDDVIIGALLRAQVSSALANARLHEEIRARMDELRETHARLVERERLAAIGEMAAVVAHEVRNPLAVIFNVAGALRRQIGAESASRPLVETLVEEAERINQIVGDLLSYARPIAPVVERAGVRALVEGALGAALADKPDGAAMYAVTVDIPDDVPEVCVDPRLAHQAFVNVISNALEAMPEGGSLTVSAAHDRARGSVCVAVRDTGVGLSAEVKARMFEAFFTTRAQGTGLGLAIVRRIVEAHHGVVRAEDAVGGGARFCLEFPAAGE